MKKKSNVNIFSKFCIYVYRFFKYLLYGIIWPLMAIIFSIAKFINSITVVNVDKLKKATKKSTQDNIYDQIKSDKSSFKDSSAMKKLDNTKKTDNLLFGIANIPKIINNRINNMSLVKQAKNKKAFEEMSMLVDFSEDKDKNKIKPVTWEYVAINEKGKKIKGYFDAFTRLDVQSFLLGEGLAVYSIKTSPLIQLLHGRVGSGGVVLKNKDLIFLLAQLSTYLKAGIPLVEALNILIRQINRKKIKLLLRDVTYDLTVGESFSSALEKRGKAFPKLLINMVKASELTGELPEVLDDMVNYYTEAEETRKEMVSALTYPSIVFIFTLAVVTFVLIYVVPKFNGIYESMDGSEIPKFTQLVMSFSDFIKANFIIILIVIIFAIIFLILLYKNIRIIRIFFQWIFMHIPVLKQVIIYNEVTMFSKTFSSLLSHNVRITDSMEILDKVSNNEFYKMMIFDTVTNLASGDKISTAFKGNWAFPAPAYEMIVTGEKTGQLAEMMYKVSTYYQGLHKSTVSRIKALVEPILIIFLTFAVGSILLAVVVPMFSMYQQVQNLG